MFQHELSFNICQHSNNLLRTNDADDRQTDEIAMAYSERKRKFTFAKNHLRGVLFFSAGGQQLLVGYGNILVNISAWINSAIKQP